MLVPLCCADITLNRILHGRGLVPRKISVVRGFPHWFAAIALPCPYGMGWPGISCLASYIVFSQCGIGDHFRVPCGL